MADGAVDPLVSSRGILLMTLPPCTIAWQYALRPMRAFFCARFIAPRKQFFEL